MVKTSSSSENNPCCSKSCKKNTETLNNKITDLAEKLSDSKNMIFHYKAAESRANCIERLTKELELIKKEKGELETKLTSFPSASKDLDNLLESQRSDKNKEGLGYSAVPPPPAQVYSPPMKDMSWTGLLEFADDTITDYSSILSKPAFKFVKAANCTEVKTNKVENARKSSVRYAEIYKRTSKSPNVKKGASRPQNNTYKSFTPRPSVHKPYRPPMRPMRPNMNAAQPKRTSVYKPTHSYLSRPVQRKSAVRTQSQVLRVSTVCCCCSRQVNTARPKAVINRKNWVNDVKTSACWVWKPVKPNSASIILKRYDYINVRGRSSHRGRTKSLSDGIPIKHRKLSFYLLGYRRRESSHCLKKNATARRKVMPLPEDCTAVIVKKKLSVKDDGFLKISAPCPALYSSSNHKCIIVYKDSLYYKRSPLVRDRYQF
nr:hypothetical protein [Tanacetum cinerariifolium]